MTEEPRRRPRARWKMLVFLGVIGVLAVLAEFLIPRMMMLSEVAKQQPKPFQPPKFEEPNLPWTTQTVTIIQPAEGSPVGVMSRQRPNTNHPIPNSQSLLAHEVVRQAILYGLRENLALRMR